MSQQPSLSLVVPAYNESARLGRSLAAIFAYLDEQPYAAELIVVDDGSTDDTSAVAERGFAAARRSEARLIRVEPNRGKGHAVRAGMLASRAPIALFTDADLSTPITETPKLVAPIRSGQYDIVFGSRELNHELIGVHQPWRREQAGRVFNLAVRLATGLPFRDTQCGFKAFRMDVCRAVVEGSRIDRFGFDVELLYVAHLAGLRLKERAVRWDDVAGSTVTLRNGIEGFLELRELRRQARRGVYDGAVASARAAAARPGAQAPIPVAGSAPAPSDASPELASAARRI